MTMKARREKPSYDRSLRPVRTPGQLGDWATLATLALAAVLWFLWPAAPPRRTAERQIPEPSCAYGVLSPNSSAGDVLGRFAASAADVDSPAPSARIPAIDLPPVPDPAPVRQTPIPPPAYAGPDRAEPVFLDPPPPFPFRTDLPVQTGLVVTVSPALRAAGFAFEQPPVTNDTVFFLSASLSFAPDGALSSLLIDRYRGPDPLLPAWRTALQFARAATNAVGTVEISCIAPAVPL